jgi:type II secretory pathway pseudopilin PulG
MSKGQSNGCGILFAAGVIAVAIFALSLPGIIPSLTKGQMTQTLSNMRQLQLATSAMAQDGIATTNANLGWPGDTGGTFSNWVQHVSPEYLGKADLCKLLSAPKFVIKTNAIPTSNSAAVLMYAVSTNSPADAVFLTTANFTNTPEGGLPPSPSAKPYGDEGFVVFRSGGDGAILKANHAGRTNSIGSFVPLCK